MFEPMRHTGTANHPIKLLALNNIPGHHFEDASAQVFHLLWLKKGAATVAIKSAEYDLNEAHAVCLGSRSFTLLKSKTLEGFYLNVSVYLLNTLQAELHHSFFPLFQPQKDKPSTLYMDEETLIATEDILLKIHKELQAWSALTNEIVKGLLKVFLLYLSKKMVQLHTPNRRRETIIMQEFYLLLGRDITIRRQVSDYASALHVTPGYLNQAIKKASGYTASHHIQQQIISHAKRKAVHSDCSMKEIAYELGFDDTSHFSKFFKINSGINFTEFKKSQLSFSGTSD